MQVILAEALGLCFGVREALAMAEQTQHPSSVTIHGELVHNECVQDRLRARGFHIAPETDRQLLPQTPRVMVTAHGISDRERTRLESAGLRLIDTTCPLVRRVHLAAQKLAADERHILIIGRPGHVEVQGIIEDLSSAEVVDDPQSVKTYSHNRLGIICQSTTDPMLASAVTAAIRAANPHADIEIADTICQPTRDRLLAMQKLLVQVDAVVVVGGRNSNNTRALVGVCQSAGKPAVHVQTAAELDPNWFRSFRVVGLTAGTSTLDETIAEVRATLIAM